MKCKVCDAENCQLSGCLIVAQLEAYLREDLEHKKRTQIVVEFLIPKSEEDKKRFIGDLNFYADVFKYVMEQGGEPKLIRINGRVMLLVDAKSN